MDIFTAIVKRCSYRGPFKNEKIPRNDLEKIVTAGLCAPSGKNAQTTNFIVVDDPILIKTISAMHTMAAMQTAQAIIVCVIDVNPAPVYEGYSFQIEDCAAAVENMLLAITGLGYGSVWIDGWLRKENHAQIIAKLLNLPDDKIIKTILPLGKPLEDVQPKDKKPFSQRVLFNRYC